MDSLSYDELKAQIEQAPKTWAPALLIVAVQKAVREKVFVEGGLERVVQSAKEKA